ncbi:NlpC/P60 family protein [Luteibacter sp. PPL201]|uniref:NlpC/P60 family protein n=1 Tax=Luteibacter sahnii TaxID=3021977 RepID=A0ABT6B7S1_9GAMM
MRQYLGLPYLAGAGGPEAYDCRGLVRAVLRDHFGRNVPVLPVGGDLSALWAASVASGEWETVNAPCPGDAVVMRGGDDPHVGVYLEPGRPGILHAFEGAGQVVWTPMDRLRFLGFSRLSFVRCHAAVAESRMT